MLHLKSKKSSMIFDTNLRIKTLSIVTKKLGKNMGGGEAMVKKKNAHRV